MILLAGFPFKQPLRVRSLRGALALQGSRALFSEDSQGSEREGGHTPVLRRVKNTI